MHAPRFSPCSRRRRVRGGSRPDRPAAVRRRRARRRPSRQRAPAATARARGTGAGRGRCAGPDFTDVAARTVDAVTNISSLQVVRQQLALRQRSALPVLLRRPTSSGRNRARRASAPASSSRRTATSSPTTTSSATRARPGDRSCCRTSASCGPRSSAPTTAPTSRCSRSTRADLPMHAVGRLVEAEGRRVGARDRQSVPAQSDRHARHRLGARPQPSAASPATRTSSRPTRRSIRATPAARWSTPRRADRHQHRDLRESGGYQGIGFAVPSNLARHVMDDLISYGEVQRGIDSARRDRPADVADWPTSWACRTSAAHSSRGCPARVRRTRRASGQAT